jgi:hypothetical protein
MAVNCDGEPAPGFHWSSATFDKEYPRLARDVWCETHNISSLCWSECTIHGAMRPRAIVRSHVGRRQTDGCIVELCIAGTTSRGEIAAVGYRPGLSRATRAARLDRRNAGAIAKPPIGAGRRHFEQHSSRSGTTLRKSTARSVQDLLVGRGAFVRGLDAIVVT